MKYFSIVKIQAYELRIVGGRNALEGRVEVKVEGIWGVICADRWTLLEARVACKQAGLGYASHVIKVAFIITDMEIYSFSNNFKIYHNRWNTTFKHLNGINLKHLFKFLKYSKIKN